MTFDEPSRKNKWKFEFQLKNNFSTFRSAASTFCLASGGRGFDLLFEWSRIFSLWFDWIRTFGLLFFWIRTFGLLFDWSRIFGLLFDWSRIFDLWFDWIRTVGFNNEFFLT
jgi:hypothetical protein